MNIRTWNMQGASYSTENKWNLCVANMLTQANICCLQECGGVPPSAQLVSNNYNGVHGLCYYTWGTARTTKHILYYQSDPNGNRCNLAIVSNTAPVGGGVVYPAAAPQWRPALGFAVAANTFVFSLHAISPNGPDAANLLTAINNTVPAAGAWAAFGDYNRDPSTLATAFVKCPPNTNTYSVSNPNAKYDYAVRKNGASVIGQVLNLVFSDHYPVGYSI